jgi:hypothetical protein
MVNWHSVEWGRREMSTFPALQIVSVGVWRESRRRLCPPKNYPIPFSPGCFKMRASGFSFQPFNIRGKGAVMKYRRFLIAFAIAISLAVLATVSPAMAAKQCDHKCLVDLMQKYVNALPKHDPTGLPFDKKIKFT